MKKLLIGAVAAIVVIIAAIAVLQVTEEEGDVQIGFLGGFTGPIESLAPPILSGAELAVQHVNDQGGILGGRMVRMPSGDTACGDASITSSSADRLVNSDNVTAIVGALCTGATLTAANNIAIPAGVVMVSPASTAPAVTELDDNGLVFRTVPSDAFQGEMLARLLIQRGIDEVAVTYVNNDYGRGLADAFADTFEAEGGTMSAVAGHEDNRADYRSDLAALSGPETLVVLAYADTSGQTILRQAYEGGMFSQFVGGDGMVGSSLIEAIGADVLEGMIATRPGSPELPGTAAFEELARAADVDPSGTFVSQAYDAAFLLALAIEKNGTSDREGLAAALREVATAPGETILPGEWEKARDLIAAGEDINYIGASGDHEFDEAGDVPGAVEELLVQDGAFVSQGFLDL